MGNPANELMQLHGSAQLLLFGVFPAIIIALGIAYGVHQWRAHKRGKRHDRDE